MSCPETLRRLKMKAALILNGQSLDTKIKEDLIICADGGYKHVIGQKVHTVLGDFDSLDVEPLADNVIKVPKEKDFTDSEFAIEYCRQIGVKKLSIYAFVGDRLDHQFANLGLLLYAHKLGIEAQATSKAVDIYLLTDELKFKAQEGDFISVVPFGNDCTIKKSSGLFYKYSNLELRYDKLGLGISNYAIKEDIFLEIIKGYALVFHNKV